NGDTRNSRIGSAGFKHGQFRDADGQGWAYPAHEQWGKNHIGPTHDVLWANMGQCLS
uniref:Uncharacterized protein n=1 Tax=Oryza brachyantha TaxID=4533 RepID=J3LBT1_ORYBR